MTPSKLRTHTSKDLAQMARRSGVAGWHSMRKEELITAIVSANRRATNPTAPSVLRNGQAGGGKNGKASNGTSVNGSNGSNGSSTAGAAKKRPTAVQRKLAAIRERQQELNDLSNTAADTVEVDRLIVLVRDPYWLHVSWELTPLSVARARTALGQQWHGAKPTLRVFRLSEDGAIAGSRQITIHGGVSHWYVDVNDPPARYRAEIGYASHTGDFYCLARSNEITTPSPGAAEAIDDNWSDVARNADRVYAMSGGYSHSGASRELQEVLEKRLRRRLGRPTETRFGAGSQVTHDTETLGVEVEAELIVYGSTSPLSHLTVQGEPVAVQPDGGFAVKVAFPDRRQVIPVVASSADGVQQKTVILGVERNTKTLEPRRRDAPAAS